MEALPEELLSRICKYLHRGQLWSLLLVDKKLARIATDILYSNVELPVHEWNWQLRSAGFLLRTLITTPNLRHRIKKIRIGDWQLPSPLTKYTGDTIMSLVDLCKIVQSILAVNSVSLEDQMAAWLKLLESSYDTITSAILCLAPNLQSLALSMDCRISGYRDLFDFNFNTLQTVNLIELSTTSLLAECNLFQKLRHVWIDGQLPEEDDYVGGWDVRLISAFMKLPALKTFRGSGFRDMKTGSDEDADMEAWICEHGASNVTEVVLADCDIGAKSICNILRSAHSLEKVECCRICNGCRQDMDLNDYSYTNVHDALNRHQNTLRSLTLNTRVCGGVNLRAFAPVKTLAALDHLDYLSLDEDALLGEDHLNVRPLAEILPKHLETMTVLSAGGSRDMFPFFQFVARGLMESEALQTIKVL